MNSGLFLQGTEKINAGNIYSGRSVSREEKEGLHRENA